MKGERERGETNRNKERQTERLTKRDRQIETERGVESRNPQTQTDKHMGVRETARGREE